MICHVLGGLLLIDVAILIVCYILFSVFGSRRVQVIAVCSCVAAIILTVVFIVSFGIWLIFGGR